MKIDATRESALVEAIDERIALALPLVEAPTTKPTRRELAERIEAFADEGLSAAEIGKRLNMSRQRVMRIAAQFKLRLQPRGGARRVGVQFNGPRYELIKQLADGAGISVGAMLVRMAGVVMDDGIVVAKKRLGRHALPKRPYTRRK